jgi:hypothetical protein
VEFEAQGLLLLLLVTAALPLQFKDRPDALALMMRHLSWHGAGRQAAAAAEPTGSAAPSAAAAPSAPAAPPAAQRSSKPRKSTSRTAEELEIMRELNLGDLPNVSFYQRTPSRKAGWRVKLGAEGIGFLHGELLCTILLAKVEAVWQVKQCCSGWCMLGGILVCSSRRHNHFQPGMATLRVHSTHMVLTLRRLACHQ